MAFLRRIRLTTVVILAFALAACGSDAPTREEASREANSAAARRASASSAEQVDVVLSAVTGKASALRPVATTTRDICHAGDTNGLWGHDTYRLRCGRGETQYLGADGDLLDVLRQVDTSAKAVGLIPVTGSAVEDVERYYAADGKTEDGLFMSWPTLGYLVPGQDWTLQVGWSQVTGPNSQPGLLDNQPVPELTWPTVFVESQPVDLRALRDGPLRKRRYLISISSGTTYYEIPWPA
ncbi:hypothetical protein NCC78_19430 [Micromonospora phytophila]|uniref:hypothetical protein n=1 Tax=Micromonospora phytophila TaxID=709888 RepID=UPI0020301607|nr:hypothetical protein [Micromonospora phytophila]MCM0676840.1 hypothetical protein [Micromonospora phytophila]